MGTTKQVYIYTLLSSVWFNFLFEGIAMAHGWGYTMAFEEYGFTAGILGAFIFSALTRKNPVIASVVGMIAGMTIVTVVVSLLGEDPLNGACFIFVIGGITFFIPMISIAIIIGVLNVYFRKEDWHRGGGR